MMLLTWSHAGPAVTAAFLASLVEAVEAATIVLAAATLRGWWPAVVGALAGLLLLAIVIAALGPALNHVPIHVLQLVIGVLLLLFGMRWLRKAILRAGGVIPLRDELRIYAAEKAEILTHARRYPAQQDWLAGVTSFKAVVLEGLEVAFVVIAVGAGRDTHLPASIGAIAACLLVCAVALAIRKPLARVPENTLKFAVGVMLSAFGVFWTGEGIGVDWPGGDFAIVAFAGLFVVTAYAAASLIRRAPQGALP
jgi:uncharacterized membrane protein